MLEPLVVSWGWDSERPSGSDFIDHLEYLGTDDLSSYLSVPAAIQFQTDHNWSQVQQQCHELAKSTLAQLCQLTGLSPLYPADTRFFQQLVIAPLPPTDLDVLKRRLYDEYRVEVPLISWNGRQFIRVSVQAYNTPSDIEVLLTALDALL